MHRLCLTHLSETKQCAIAAAVGCSEGQISKVTNQYLELLCNVLAHAGLKVVSQEYRCFDERTIESILHLARQRMEELDSVKKLEWGDE